VAELRYPGLDVATHLRQSTLGLCHVSPVLPVVCPTRPVTPSVAQLRPRSTWSWSMAQAGSNLAPLDHHQPRTLNPTGLDLHRDIVRYPPRSPPRTAESRSALYGFRGPSAMTGP